MIGKCIKGNRKKSMIATDKTIKTEGLWDLFRNSGKSTAKAAKNVALKVAKNKGC